MSRHGRRREHAWTQQGFQAYGVGGGERNEVEGIWSTKAPARCTTPTSLVRGDGGDGGRRHAEVRDARAYQQVRQQVGQQHLPRGTSTSTTRTKRSKRTTSTLRRSPPAWRAASIPDARDLNRLSLFRDFTADVGGYLKKDRLWWYFALPQQRRRPAVPHAGRRHPAHLRPGLQRQGHRQPRRRNHKLVGYYQHASKVQPDYLGAIALADRPRLRRRS